jgi:hypothetical protein
MKKYQWWWIALCVFEAILVAEQICFMLTGVWFFYYGATGTPASGGHLFSRCCFAVVLAIVMAFFTIKLLQSENARLAKDAESLRRVVRDFDDLIKASTGVAGLHLNGEVADWESLRTGGQFEEWLCNFDVAIKGEQT